jgi:hypothetical protein
MRMIYEERRAAYPLKAGAQRCGTTTIKTGMELIIGQLAME